jgi:hypothetical protein
VGRTRSIIPSLDLSFDSPVLRSDSSRDIVFFTGKGLNGSVRCSISREALEDHFDADNTSVEGRIEAARRHRSRIEQLLRAKYLSKSVAEAEAVLLKTDEIDSLSALTL